MISNNTLIDKYAENILTLIQLAIIIFFILSYNEYSLKKGVKVIKEGSFII
jgi:hypothetical protein